MLAMARPPAAAQLLPGRCPRFARREVDHAHRGFVATMAALLPLRILAELVNIGTLLAFVIVCAAVLIMRVTNPKADRPFRVPWSPLLPALGIVMCLMLMFSLPSENNTPRGMAADRLCDLLRLRLPAQRAARGERTRGARHHAVGSWPPAPGSIEEQSDRLGVALERRPGGFALIAFLTHSGRGLEVAGEDL
jgi:amino acid transporter